MNFLNDDFSVDQSDAKSSIQAFREFYLSTVSPFATPTPNSTTVVLRDDPFEDRYGKAGPVGTLFWNTMVLSERSARNYARNLLAYGVRIGMYGGESVPSGKIQIIDVP